MVSAGRLPVTKWKSGSLEVGMLVYAGSATGVMFDGTYSACSSFWPSMEAAT